MQSKYNNSSPDIEYGDFLKIAQFNIVGDISKLSNEYVMPNQSRFYT
jgi:hypothetical protein